MTRRSFLRASAAFGTAGAAGLALRPSHARLIEAALSSDQAPTGSLSDIEHIVILMQENRSFDHYFGTLSGVRGFSDTGVATQLIDGSVHKVFDQLGPTGFQVDGAPYLQPFELMSNFPTENGETTNDITHDWGPQHFSWNSGAMDQFLKAHLATDGSKNGFLTMGYFTRDDLPFYHALADAFTICDAYHCSVLGPTDPNRLMFMSGSIGSDGKQGGPIMVTYTNPLPYFGSLDWLTFPEVLTESGVSWKVYQDPTAPVLFNVLPFFKNYVSPSTSRDAQVAANGLLPQYPAEFIADVAAGILPSVSWIMPPLYSCEHPAAPPEYGEWLVAQILQTLVSKPDVWAKTVFLVVYDENGGWFDHVPPPTPGPMILSKSDIPTSDDLVGEYITAPQLPSPGKYSIDGENLSIYGPMGLGFRTPCLVISPFSRGGYLCSETFDHISLFKLISTRFGVPVPNVSKWRLDTVGDMTAALALTMPPNTSVPPLPATSLTDPEVAAQAVLNALAGTFDEAPLDYPPPTKNSGVPAQETSPNRTRLPLVGIATPPIGTPAGAGAAQAGSAQGSGSSSNQSGSSGSGGSSMGSGPRATGGAGATASSGSPGPSYSASSGHGSRSGRRPATGSNKRAISRSSGSGGDDAGLIVGIAGGAVALGLALVAGARRLLPFGTKSESASGSSQGSGDL